MIRISRSGACLLLTIICLGAPGCVHLQRPAVTPTRMIEPQVLDPQLSTPATEATKAANATPVRLLDTQARADIRRPMLRRQPNGELTEDAVWLWSSAPDRYLDTAIRLAAASNPNVRLVDTSAAPALAATLLVWDLESGNGTELVGAVQFQVTGPDGAVQNHVVRGTEPVSAELPGDLAAASGRLLRRLASEGLAYATSQ